MYDDVAWKFDVEWQSGKIEYLIKTHSRINKLLFCTTVRNCVWFYSIELGETNKKILFSFSRVTRNIYL
jgi:hypothetical protein